MAFLFYSSSCSTLIKAPNNTMNVNKNFSRSVNNEARAYFFFFCFVIQLSDFFSKFVFITDPRGTLVLSLSKINICHTHTKTNTTRWMSV